MFTQQTFATVGAQAAPSPTVYSYKTSDSVTTVEAAGYFVAKENQLEEGDIILIQHGDGFGVFTVMGDTSTVVTVATPSNLRYVTSLDDLPEAAAGVITLADSTEYRFYSIIDGDGSRLVTGQNTVISSPSPGIGGFVTDNAAHALTLTGGFFTSSVQGGTVFDNATGGCIKVEPNAIALISGSLHREGSIGVEADSPLILDLMSVTPAFDTVNGINIYGTCGSIFMSNVSPSGISGYGVVVNTTSCIELRAEKSPMLTGGKCWDISGTIAEITVDGSTLRSTGDDTFCVSGVITRGMVLSSSSMISDIADSINITGSTIERLKFSDLDCEAPAGFSLVGDSASANIGSAGIIDSCNLGGVSGPLSGITQLDLKYTFMDSSNVRDTVTRGAMYFGGPSATPITTTLTTGTPEILEGTMTAGEQDNRWIVIENPDSATASALQYIGLTEFAGTMSVTLDGEKNGGGTLVADIGAYKNAGTPDSGDLPFNPPRHIELAGTVESIAFNVEVCVVAGDVIDIRINRTGSLADWDTRNIFISVD